MRAETTLRNTAKTLASRGRRVMSEDGISMVAAMMALMAGMLLAAAAWATANTEIRAASQDRWSRVAYQRAQTGVSDYVKRLANDPNFWSACDRGGLALADNGLGTTAINDTIYGQTYDTAYGTTNGHTTRRWLPWSTSGSSADRATDSQYTIDIIPADGYDRCGSINEATATERLVNKQTGTFRVRVTGRAGPPVPSTVLTNDIEQWRQSNWKRSSVVVEFRRAGFLDYVYFTDHEALDPAFIRNINQTLIGSFVAIFNPPNYTNCDKYYRYTSAALLGRENVENPGGWICPNERPIYNGEEVRGPVHTNDSFSVESFSGGTAPIFGNANKGDRVEVYDNGASGSVCTSGQRSGNCACPFRRSQSFAGTGIATGRTCSATQRVDSGVQLITGPDAGDIEMPTGNDELIFWAGLDAPNGHLYKGRTKITLRDDGKYDVVNTYVSRTGVDYPESGVIYVKNDTGAGSCESNTDAEYTNATLPGGMQSGCALTEVSGTYNDSLTIGSQADIVATGSIQRKAGTSALLGLVANNYVRIRHYSTGAGDYNYYKKCSTPPIAFWLIIWFYIPDISAHASCMKMGSSGASFISGLVTLLQSNPFDSDPLVGYTCERESSPVSASPVMRIDAALLALKRSITVDSSNCGNTIGSAANPLVFNGAMTQSWRGGITGKDWSHIFDAMCAGTGRPGDFWGGIWYDFQAFFASFMGYCNNNHAYAAKQFNYDYLLRALSPPHFLKPSESSWRINRIRQTVPACNCGPTG
jgi:Tfp pilus assembly protein PilX